MPPAKNKPIPANGSGLVSAACTVRKIYDTPATSCDRPLACKNVHAATKAKLWTLRAALDPFALAQDIERRLTEIFALVKEPLDEPQDEHSPKMAPSEEIPPPAADVADVVEAK